MAILPTKLGQVNRKRGRWDYHAGVSGTVIVPDRWRVIGIAAHSTLGGTVSIDGGDVTPIPSGVAIVIAPEGNLFAPSIEFVGTDTFFVEIVTSDPGEKGFDS